MSLEWNGDEVMDELRDAARKAGFEATSELLTRANDTVPHDEGTLEASGVVTQGRLPSARQIYEEAQDGEPQGDALSLRGEPLFFLTYNTPYAVKVHEAPPSWDFRGKGQRKWLEKTVREERDDIEGLITDRINEEMD